LTPLNVYAPLPLGRVQFHRVEYQYGTFFAQIYPPVLFVFGVVAIVLNGIQVFLAVDIASPNTERPKLLLVCLICSIIMVL
jgi:hypothetical protein